MTHDDESMDEQADALADDVVPVPDDDSAANDSAEPSATPGRWRPSGSFWVAVAIVVVGLTAVVGVWFWASNAAPVATPALVSLTPAEAEKVLANAHLVSGKATYEVTRSYPSGVIIAQSPLPYVRVPQGSAVNVRVTAAPKAIKVPDVVGADSAYARSLLEYQLLRPMVLYAYSKDVRASSVIEQLPRAGDTAMTGSIEVLVVSLGPGVPGATVPAMKGMPFTQASKVASAATLFAQPRTVIATGTPDGTVVDQAPSAGTIVPVASVVWVSVAVPASGQ